MGKTILLETTAQAERCVHSHFEFVGTQRGQASSSPTLSTRLLLSGNPVPIEQGTVTFEQPSCSPFSVSRREGHALSRGQATASRPLSSLCSSSDLEQQVPNSQTLGTPDTPKPPACRTLYSDVSVGVHIPHPSTQEPFATNQSRLRLLPKGIRKNNTSIHGGVAIRQSQAQPSIFDHRPGLRRPSHHKARKPEKTNVHQNVRVHFHLLLHESVSLRGCL